MTLFPRTCGRFKGVSMIEYPYSGQDDIYIGIACGWYSIELRYIMGNICVSLHYMYNL